jgi:hypothetical protein
VRVLFVRGTPSQAAQPVRIAGGPIVLGAVLLDTAGGRRGPGPKSRALGNPGRRDRDRHQNGTLT